MRNRQGRGRRCLGTACGQAAGHMSWALTTHRMPTTDWNPDAEEMLADGAAPQVAQIAHRKRPMVRHHHSIRAFMPCEHRPAAAQDCRRTTSDACVSTARFATDGSPGRDRWCVTIAAYARSCAVSIGRRRHRIAGAPRPTRVCPPPDSRRCVRGLLASIAIPAARSGLYHGHTPWPACPRTPGAHTVWSTNEQRPHG
jgi:hypothetical protein